MIEKRIMEILRYKFGDRVEDFLIPPPSFVEMQGEFLDYDSEHGVLKTRFPVLEKFLNPYGSMQGGMVAAAVDNTFGPLSMLIAPPNVTRRFEIKYSRPITMEMDFILVDAKFIDRQDRWLTLAADVRDQGGPLLARARGIHWILDSG